MIRLGLVGLWVVSGIGCAACGSFVVSGAQATNFEGETYNGHWFEECGANYGTTGTWNLFGDGFANLEFRPSASGDRDWLGIDLEIGASFPTDQIAEGATVTDVVGGAAINPGITLHEDVAGLTSGTIEIESFQGLDDVCADDGPTLRVHWDLTYGAEPGPVYVVKGTDRVLFSNFLSEDCPEPY